MASDFLSLGGEPISPDAQRIEKARNLAEFVRSGLHPWAQFVESRALREREVVVLDLSIEVGQVPVHPIRDIERIAAIFDAADEAYPEVLSLRPDFPRVLHLNATPTEFPRSLCLYEEPYDELKLRWTAPSFVERIRFWLRETARGTLHQPDQPLEQILVGANVHLVLPPDLYETTLAGNAERLEVFRCGPGPKGEVLIAERPHQRRQAQRGTRCVTTAFCCPPQVHSAVRFVPRTLTQLHEITAAAGLDLISALRDRLDSWQRENAPLDSPVILVLFFPKTRADGAEVEHSDIWAFISPNTVGDFGAALGLWQVQNGIVGRLLSATPGQVRGDDILFDVLNPTLALSRDRAAFLNGLAPDARKIVAIGLGALGSQVVTKLIRCGFGTWTFVDPDFLLPHNVARHELCSQAVGFGKAQSMQLLGNSFIEGEAVVSEAIAADVLRPGVESERLSKSLVGSDAIADFSASIPVARHLARDVTATGRRISAFLNPSGTDLVVLAEDAKRAITLDCLEMQYYRAIVRHSALSHHLAKSSRQTRYARSCRDVTATIPEELISLHASIASRALRRALNSEAATACIWRSDEAMSVECLDLNPAEVIEIQMGDWRICVDHHLLATIAEIRAEKLPNETGGVLLGSFDLKRRIAYVADTIPSPPDSVERPMAYIRGCQGLLEGVHKIEGQTGGMLQYVGEWHSHPDGFSLQPSKDDRDEFAWLAGYMKADGLVPLMLIAGDQSWAWFLERIE
jgi:hypothetical protein